MSAFDDAELVEPASVEEWSAWLAEHRRPAARSSDGSPWREVPTPGRGASASQ